MNLGFDKYLVLGAYHYAATLGAKSFLRRDLMLDARYNAVIAALRPLRGKICLDAGSGEGVAAIIAAHAGASVVCVDLEPEAVALGKSVAMTTAVSEQVHQARGDLMHLPFADATFDGAFSSEVIEHIPDDRQFLRELARVVKDGGAVSITTPLRVSDDAPIAPYHVREYSRPELLALLSEFLDEVHVDSAWSGRLFHIYTALPLRSLPSMLIRATFKALAAVFGNPFRGPTRFDNRCPVLVAVGRVRHRTSVPSAA